MNAFNWLHLTDLHRDQTGQKHLWPNVESAFHDDLGRLHERCGPWHAVLFTGDLVQKGEKFAEMQEEVLAPLWKRLQKLGSSPVLLAVPGNHDLQRPKKSAAVRQLVREGGFLEIAEDEFWDTRESEYRKVIDKAFADYRAWSSLRPFCDEVEIQDGLLPGDFSTTLTTDSGRRIGILGLNTTFLQLAEGDFRQRLAWDVRQFHEACGGDGVAWTKKHDICLLLTHQGSDWLDQVSLTKGYAEINPAGRFAVHLFGHMHEVDIRNLARGGGAVSRSWQGPSLFGLEHYAEEDEDRRHGYSCGTIRIEGDSAFLRHWPRAATFDQHNGWRFVPDYPNCVLEDDQGTGEERIALNAENRPPDPTGTALGVYHTHVQETWSDRWSDELDVESDE